MMPAWHQLVPMSGHVEESETARQLQLYATPIKTCVSTELIVEKIMKMSEKRDMDFVNVVVVCVKNVQILEPWQNGTLQILGKTQVTNLKER